MGYIFGSGNIFSNGNMSHNNKDFIYKMGNFYNNTNGQSAVNVGGTLFTGSGAIRQMGNTWIYKGMTFHRIGSTLQGGGRTWHNIQSDEDVRRVLLHEF